MRKVMTELDKLECTEYVLDLLDKTLRDDGPFSTAHGLWIQRAKDECVTRRGQYLGSARRSPYKPRKAGQ